MTVQTHEPVNLDYKWLEEGLEKRRSNFSTILCFETKDPKRHDQIKVIAAYPDYQECEVYAYMPWNGLMRLNRAKESWDFEAVSQSPGEYGELAGVENRVTDLCGALKQMDRALKQERTVFILEGLDSHRDEEKSQELLHALRAWAHDPDILYTGSLIVLIVGSVGRVLDELTADLVALKRPPLALPQERARIIDDLSRQLDVELNEREALILATSGLNLHQLECVLREAWHKTHRFPLDLIKQLKSEFIERSQLVELEEPSWGFDEVGGYQAVKRFIHEYIIKVMKDPGRAKRFGLPLPRGILLFGPPGTGKTLLAKALAKETNLPFINFRTENLFVPWLGASGQNFREAIRLAEQMSPAIVFIDEIDRFGRRGSGGPNDGASEETRKVFNQVLEWLGDQNRRSIIVGTTNRPQDLDEAFTREGRFDYKIPFLYPGKAARRQILEIHLGLSNGSKPRPALGMSEEELQRLLAELVEGTEGFTGAELEQLVIRAKRHAFRRNAEAMVRTDFIKALEGFHIDRQAREQQKAQYLTQAAEFTNDLEFLQEVEAEQ